MLFRREILEGIARGEVKLAFRRWKRGIMKAGGSVRTALGVVRIGTVEQVELGAVSGRDASASGLSSLAELWEMLGPDDGTPVYRIELLGLEADGRVQLREAADLCDAEWRDLEVRFERWEKSAPGYFPRILAVIGRSSEVAAASLAAELGVEKVKFKHDVRKLKELGLTESLEIGYRLSPRGKSVLNRISN